MSEASPAPIAPAAPTPTAAPSAPTGETPVPQAGDTPPAPPAGETPAQPDDAEKSDRARHRRQLNTAYRKAAEAAARAEFFEKQYHESRAKSAPETDPAAPRLEQFKDIEDYAAAKAKHESEKTLKDFQQRQQGETQKHAQARISEGWENASERGAGKYDDFETIVGELKPTSPWSMAVMTAENGDEVAYHLGKNLKEAGRIAALPPMAQIFEIGRLSAKLAAEPPKPKTPSRAPAPITPLSGAAPLASDVPSADDDMKSWMRKRQKQVHKR